MCSLVSMIIIMGQLNLYWLIIRPIWEVGEHQPYPTPLTPSLYFILLIRGSTWPCQHNLYIFSKIPNFNSLFCLLLLTIQHIVRNILSSSPILYYSICRRAGNSKLCSTLYCSLNWLIYWCLSKAHCLAKQQPYSPYTIPNVVYTAAQFLHVYIVKLWPRASNSWCSFTSNELIIHWI